MSTAASSDVSFETAKREFQSAWNNSAYTRFELPPINVNKVLRDLYHVTLDTPFTRTMLWDMELKKAWDPLTYIPYVVSTGQSWGRHTLQDDSERFCRSSLQLGWITPERGRVLEEVFVNHSSQGILFLGRPQMTAESGEGLRARGFQPLFHVEHGVGGSEEEPLNIWRIVLLTAARDPRYEEPFKKMVQAGELPGFIEIYIQRDLQIPLMRSSRST